MADRDDIARLLAKAFEDTCEITNCSKCEYVSYGEECRDYLYADILLIAGYRKQKENLMAKPKEIKQ